MGPTTAREASTLLVEPLQVYVYLLLPCSVHGTEHEGMLSCSPAARCRPQELRTTSRAAQDQETSSRQPPGVPTNS